MGRPPLNRDDETVRTILRLEATVLARIEAVAGKNRRAAFIRRAIEECLAKHEKP